MRYLVCLIVGALIGTLLTMSVVGALQRHNVWPRALMNVMQHELRDARDAVQRPDCSATVLHPARTRLQLLADDVERAALAPGVKDRVFSQYANDLRERLAQWDTDAACARQSAALTTVANACDSCHRDYR